MANVRCEFCGNYIDETRKTCPNCGGTNAAYMRTAHDTPKTIAELQSWYKAKNLPPEETTRVFIGKDVKSPKAFGIYKDGENFVVYKNRADGQRSIRYSGTDEAYAVNELYQKLKELILGQKSANIQRQARSTVYSQQPRSTYRAPSSSTYRSTPSYRTSYPDFVRSYRRNRGFGKAIAWIVVFFALIVILFSAVPSLARSSPRTGYYIQDGDLYYTPDCHEWWVYREGDDDWTLFSQEAGLFKYPAPLSGSSTHTRSLPFDEETWYNDDRYDISNSHAYYDAHPKKPTTAYYYYDGTPYYFLSDDYGSSYGDGDLTGWYVYDDDSDKWEYYAAADDKEALGTDLWYNADSYHLYDEDKLYWDSSFYDSEFYQDYQTSYDAYQDYWSSRSNDDNNNNNNWNWDNDDDNYDNNYDNDDDWDWGDDDYDWDNDDWDWDDDGYDWDSDW